MNQSKASDKEKEKEGLIWYEHDDKVTSCNNDVVDDRSSYLDIYFTKMNLALFRGELIDEAKRVEDECIGEDHHHQRANVRHQNIDLCNVLLK